MDSEKAKKIILDKDRDINYSKEDIKEAYALAFASMKTIERLHDEILDLPENELVYNSFNEAIGTATSTIFSFKQKVISYMSKVLKEICDKENEELE